MALRAFFNEVKTMRVRDFSDYIRPKLSVDYLKQSVDRKLDNYIEKYIYTNTILPVFHIAIGGMAFSYLVALPEERRHLAHKQHAEQHGAH